MSKNRTTNSHVNPFKNQEGFSKLYWEEDDEYLKEDLDEDWLMRYLRIYWERELAVSSMVGDLTDLCHLEELYRDSIPECHHHCSEDDFLYGPKGHLLYR